MNKVTLYIVGDSTLSSFKDISYYYPRYGYATQLHNYFKNINIVNLALSGRSSKSYLLENNYTILTNSLNKNDFLLIGFGHNDQKDDDFIRYSSANGDKDTEGTFKYYLNKYYIQLALAVGATPIICTPVVRLDEENDFSGNSAHITPNGDYRKAILELAGEVGIDSVDLTTLTKNEFLKIGYDESRYHHAMTSAIKKDNNVIADPKSVDKAHLNIFGAKYVAYLLAKEINKTNNPIKKHLVDNIIEPTKELDLNANPDYVYIEYKYPDLVNYKPLDRFKCVNDGWYGTAFGDLGISPMNDESGLVAYQDNDSFIVGQKGEKLYGKMHASTDAIALVFNQISLNKNFEFSAKAHVKEFITSKQSGFGVMLRDDCYINQESDSFVVASNYVANGFITADSSTYIIFSRESTTEQNKGPYVINEFYKENDIVEYKLKRLGQLISVSLKYNDKLYEKNYFDFDLAARDGKYMYIGMYATRGTVVEFTDVNLVITGDAKEA